MKNTDIHIAAEKRRLSFALALLMHAGLLLFLLASMRWQNQAIAPVEVEIWEGAPLPSKAAPAQASQDTAEFAQPAAHAEAVALAPDIVEEKQTLKVEKPVKDVGPNKKPVLIKQEKKLKEKQGVVKEAQYKKQSDNPLDLQHLLQSTLTKPNNSTVGKSGAGAGATTNTGKAASALEEYLHQLQKLIRDKTIYAGNGTSNPSAVLKIFVLPDGTIRDVQIVNTSGDPAFAIARQQALLMMQRLPPLPAGIRFSEQREWTVRTRLRE
jgi:colicin import membrane protein